MVFCLLNIVQCNSHFGTLFSHCIVSVHFCLSKYKQIDIHFATVQTQILQYHNTSSIIIHTTFANDATNTDNVWVCVVSACVCQ